MRHFLLFHCAGSSEKYKQMTKNKLLCKQNFSWKDRWLIEDYSKLILPFIDLDLSINSEHFPSTELTNSNISISKNYGRGEVILGPYEMMNRKTMITKRSRITTHLLLAIQPMWTLQKKRVNIRRLSNQSFFHPWGSPPNLKREKWSEKL